jgi:hypothetical protein
MARQIAGSSSTSKQQDANRPESTTTVWTNHQVTCASPLSVCEELWRCKPDLIFNELGSDAMTVKMVNIAIIPRRSMACSISVERDGPTCTETFKMEMRL